MLREHRESSKPKEPEKPKEPATLPHVTTTTTGSWRIDKGGNDKATEEMSARTLHKE